MCICAVVGIGKKTGFIEKMKVNQEKPGAEHRTALWLDFRVGLGFTLELIELWCTIYTHIGDFMQRKISSASFLFISYNICVICACEI